MQFKGPTAAPFIMICPCRFDLVNALMFFMFCILRRLYYCPVVAQVSVIKQFTCDWLDALLFWYLHTQGLLLPSRNAVIVRRFNFYSVDVFLWCSVCARFTVTPRKHQCFASLALPITHYLERQRASSIMIQMRDAINYNSNVPS